MESTCPFCPPDPDRVVASNEHAVALRDGFPESPGHTVMHLHVHLIPRFDGDRPDPRGGVRWVIPDKADYWSARS